jgi:malto-oligosyltrehalose synthase
MDWHGLTHDTKRAVADGILNSETARIARDAAREIDARVDEDVLVDAVAELLACFPVYRSYLPDGRLYLETAIAEAVTRRPELHVTFKELETVLTDGTTDAAARFQQTSGMVMAKGVEDCAFYRWGRLTSLTEVGADPSIFSLTPEQVYQQLATRQALWPRALSTRTTHDTKRGEDVRARISVLSEVPQLWASAVRRLQERAPMPDAGFANILWQAAVGAWPISADRLHAFAEKAMREAGEHTTWTNVNDEYEASVHAAIDLLYSDDDVKAVLDEVLAAVVDAGWSNSLSEAAVTLTMPGVPDVYQGSELWQLSLVDPDNRRPVDFLALEDMVGRVDGAHLVGGVDDPGTAKQKLVREALRLRRDQPELFRTFAPVSSQGSAAEHVVAFDTGGVVTLATRLPVGLTGEGRLGRHVDRPAARQLPRRDQRRRDPRGRLLSTRGRGLRGRPGRAARGASGTRRDPYPLRRLGSRPRLGDPRRTPVGDPVAERQIRMRPAPDGWWTPPTLLPKREYDYGYIIDGADEVLPDPRSRRQPDGVHGLSRTVDPSAGTTGRTARGPAGSSPGRSCTSCTSVRSRRKARSTPRSPTSTTSSRWGSASSS